MLLLVFVTYWCDTKFSYRMYSLYGKEVPAKLTCIAEAVLKVHETSSIATPKGTVYLCSRHKNSWINNQAAVPTSIEDAYTHEPMNKIFAIVGLKKRGEPHLVYFKNGQNFQRYYSERESDN